MGRKKEQAGGIRSVGCGRVRREAAVTHKPATEPRPRGWLIFKKQKITSTGEDVEESELLCPAGGNVN